MYVTFLLPLERAPKVLAPSLSNYNCALEITKTLFLTLLPYKIFYNILENTHKDTHNKMNSNKLNNFNILDIYINIVFICKYVIFACKILNFKLQNIYASKIKSNIKYKLNKPDKTFFKRLYTFLGSERVKHIVFNIIFLLT